MLSLSPVIKEQKARVINELIQKSIKKGHMVTPVTNLCPEGRPSLPVGYLDEPRQIISRAWQELGHQVEVCCSDWQSCRKNVKRHKNEHIP